MAIEIYEDFQTIDEQLIICLGYKIDDDIKQPLYSLQVHTETFLTEYSNCKEILNNSIINGQVS